MLDLCGGRVQCITGVAGARVVVVLAGWEVRGDVGDCGDVFLGEGERERLDIFSF